MVQAAESSAARVAFPGPSEHKEDLGTGFAVGIMSGQSRARHLPPLPGPGWAGTAGPAQGMDLTEVSWGTLLGDEEP